jgi:hypothetical protein
VLPKSAQFVGGRAAALFYKDAASKSGDVAYYCGIDPHYRQLYFDKYIKLDPLTIGHFFAEVEQPVAIADIMPYDEFPGDALLQGMGAAAAGGRLRERCAGEVRDGRRFVWGLSARTVWTG